MYLLLNDKNVIMYITERCDYVEGKGWQINPHLIVGKNADRVEVDCIPSYVVPNIYLYRDGEFVRNPEFEKPESELKMETLEENYKSLSKDMALLSNTVYGVDPSKLPLDEYKSYLRNRNNLLLQTFLEDNPLQWSDGKYYSASKEDQSLLINNFNAYQLQVSSGIEAKLEWNSADSMCREFTVEEYCALMGAIYAYAKKMVKLCQWYKVKIVNAVTRDEAEAIDLNYSVEKADEIIEFLTNAAEKSSS